MTVRDDGERRRRETAEGDDGGRQRREAAEGDDEEDDRGTGTAGDDGDGRGTTAAKEQTYSRLVLIGMNPHDE